MSHWETPGASNEWYTPPHVFDALGCRFDLDVASPPRETFVPCRGRLTSGALVAAWFGFVWMNPPFEGRNGLTPWMDRFFDHGDGIALTPDRTSAPWFWKAWQRADLVLFTRKIRFLRPDGTEGKSPSNGTALWAVGALGCAALRRSAARGLGILAAPCDSGRLPEGEDSRSEAECAASQSGGATSAASPIPKPPNHPSNREAT